MNGINTNKYWIERGKIYFGSAMRESILKKSRLRRQERILTNFLRRVPFKSVLEVGCGYGRILKLLAEHFSVERLDGIDFSPKQVENARRYLGGKANIAVGTIYDLDKPDDSYDLVLAVSVLMHLPFNKIEKALKELIRVSRKHIISWDWYEQDALGQARRGYCFCHDFSSLFNKLDVTKLEVLRLNGYLDGILNLLRKKLGFSLESYLGGLPLFGSLMGFQCQITHAILE